jgi:hypothetical protein
VAGRVDAMATHLTKFLEELAVEEEEMKVKIEKKTEQVSTGSEKCLDGKVHGQEDAKWIVIRGHLRGHNDTPFGRPNGNPRPAYRPSSGWLPLGRNRWFKLLFISNTNF